MRWARANAIPLALAFLCLVFLLLALRYAAQAEALETTLSIQADREARQLRDATMRFEGVRDACRAVLEVRYP